MIIGIILIICGVLIAMYPPLLSVIVATFLIFVGITLFGMSYRYKKFSRKMEDPFLDFFMKM